MPTFCTFLRQAIAAALALLLAPASALCFTVGNLNYNFQSGSDTDVDVSGLANSSATDITIPSTVQYNSQTYRVTSIGYYAFDGCSSLTSVTIPDSVTNIEDGAFRYCSGLTSVTLGNSVTSIGNYAFSGCSSLTSVTIPDSVTSIRHNAFSGCASALYDTNSIPGVRLVDGWAIGNQSPFGELDLMGIRGIGDSAFSNCSGLTRVTIGDSVTSIGYYAFDGCSSLTSVTIPDSVTSIRYEAFSGCASALYDTNSIPGVRLVDGWAIGNQSPFGELDLMGIRGIGDSAFSNCSGLTSVTIGDSVTSIGSYAFEACSSLTSVTIGDSVTSIGGSAFYNCSGLTRVTIGDSVTSIGSYAFEACSGLTRVTIGDSVTSIGYRAFSGCSSLTSVTIPDSVTSIGRSAFEGCSGLASVTIGDSVTGIGGSAFYNCSGLTSVTIPDSVTSIGSSAFRGCRGLTGVTIPDSVTSIGYRAFSGCSGLTGVTIPDSVTSIGDSAFYGCSGLTSVTIPACVCQSTMSNVFPSAYRSIADLTISGAVAHVGDNAFTGCTNLARVEVQDLDAWCSVSFDVGESPLSYAHHLFHDGKEVTEMVIPDGVAGIGAKLFAGCSAFTSVTIPGSVTNIGPCAFSNCFNLKGVAIPDSVKSIGIGAFENCKGLGALSIGKGVESIAEGMATSYDCHATFGNAYTLTAFYVDPGNPHFKSVNGVIYTKDGKELVAFPAGCRGEFAVPNGVEKIWAGAFCGAYDLTLVIVPDSVTDIGGGVFSGCTSLKNIYMPARFRGNESTYFAGSTYGHTFTYGRPVERELELDGQGGLVETVTIHPMYCEAMPAISIPTRDGYRFCGYFSEPDGGGVQYYTATGESCRTWDSISVTTLYAKWEWNPVAVPVITPGDGAIFSGESCEVAIFCTTTGAVIYYSTNGTTPRLSETFRYTGPFSISDSTVVKAVAVLDGTKSEYATASIRRLAVTLAEAAGAPELPFATGGAADWTPVGDATSESGLAAQCGAVGANGETWMETRVSGAGSLAFAWKVDCEKDDSGEATWDHLAVAVDGTERERMDGTTAWATVTLALEGPGPHTIRWTFAKDDYDEGVSRDLAWVSGVRWVPEEGGDSFPEAANEAEVAAALSGAADGRLGERIRTVVEYNAFRAWAAAKGLDAGTVMGSAHAWISYALGAEALFGKEPEIVLGEMSVGRDGAKGAGSGVAVEVGVTVKDGGTAVAVDPSKVAGMFEATGDLRDWEGEAKIPATATPTGSEGAEMRFEVVPGDGMARTAFLRIAL